MYQEKDIQDLSFNLSYLTNYFLNNVVKKKENVKPVLIFNNKPIITKYINKIIFPDKNLYSEEEYLQKYKTMEELKKNILINVNNEEIKENVLKEIFFYKNKEALFKFTDIKTLKSVLIYKKNIKYDFFLIDIFNDEKNYIYIKNIINGFIKKFVSRDLTILNKKKSKFTLNLEVKFIKELNDLNINENTNLYEIKENQEIKDLMFEIYNYKKKDLLYILILINIAFKKKIINFNKIFLITKTIYENLNEYFKLNKNFIISQEINLLSYLFVFNKCILDNTKFKFKNITKEKKKEFDIFYSEYFLTKIFSYPNNFYLKFILD